MSTGGRYRTLPGSAAFSPGETASKIVGILGVVAHGSLPAARIYLCVQLMLWLRGGRPLDAVQPRANTRPARRSRQYVQRQWLRGEV